MVVGLNTANANGMCDTMASPLAGQPPRRDLKWTRRRRCRTSAATVTAAAILTAALPLPGPPMATPTTMAEASELIHPLRGRVARYFGADANAGGSGGPSRSSGVRSLAPDGGIFRVAAGPDGRGNGDDGEHEKKKREGERAGQTPPARGGKKRGQGAKNERQKQQQSEHEPGVGVSDASLGGHEQGGDVAGRDGGQGRGQDRDEGDRDNRDRNINRVDLGAGNDVSAAGVPMPDEDAMFGPENPAVSGMGTDDPTYSPTTVGPTPTPTFGPTSSRPTLPPTPSEEDGDEDEREQIEWSTQSPRGSADNATLRDAGTNEPPQQPSSSSIRGNGDQDKDGGGGNEWSLGIVIGIAAGGAVVLSVVIMAIISACRRTEICCFKGKEYGGRGGSVMARSTSRRSVSQARLVETEPKTRLQRLREWIEKKHSSRRFRKVGDRPCKPPPEWDVSMHARGKKGSNKKPVLKEKQPSSRGAKPVVKGRPSQRLTMEEALRRDVRLRDTVREIDDDDEGNTGRRPPSPNKNGKSSKDASREKGSQDSPPGDYSDCGDDGVMDDATFDYRY